MWHLTGPADCLQLSAKDEKPKQEGLSGKCASTSVMQCTSAIAINRLPMQKVVSSNPIRVKPLTYQIDPCCCLGYRLDILPLILLGRKTTMNKHPQYYILLQ